MGHTFAHAPQFELSVAVFTHRPAQTVVPVGHAQRPAVHTWPVRQVTPQPPQFEVSDAVLMQRPPQYVVPLGQPQTPRMHD